MDTQQSIDELRPDEYLRKRIDFLRNKVKELRAEIKKSEDLLTTYELNSIPAQQQQLKIYPSEKLDFSVTYWKPKVYQFLFDNPTAFISEAILLGIDLDKEYQKNKEDKKRAIKSISSSLFQLHSEKKVQKHKNDGRRGHRWAVIEPGEKNLAPLVGFAAKLVRGL